MCNFCKKIFIIQTGEIPFISGFIEYDESENQFCLGVDSYDPNYTGYLDNIKYCPYCGRKLEVKQNDKP